jgi:hypothetical protein
LLLNQFFYVGFAALSQPLFQSLCVNEHPAFNEKKVKKGFYEAEKGEKDYF